MPDIDTHRFRELIEPHLDALFRAAFRLVRNTPAAEDLVQETCIRALPRMRELLDVAQPRSWLLRVQHNLFLDDVRRQRRSPFDAADDATALAEHACGDDGPEQSLLRDQAEEELHRAWLRLDPGHRSMLALRAEGYALDEIAEITGIDKDMLNSRLYRARLGLLKRLREERREAPDESSARAPAAPRRMENAK